MIILLLLFALMMEVLYSPRLDYTREGKLLLWYGKDVRKHIVLF